MQPTTFERPEDFRAWWEQHHDTERELWVGYHTTGSGRPSMTWPRVGGRGALLRLDRRDRSGIYSYEQRDRAVLDTASERRFRSKKKAWSSFEAMPRRYRQAASRWVMTTKKEETRERRLATLIECSAAGRTVPPLTRPQARGGSRSRSHGDPSLEHRPGA